MKFFQHYTIVQLDTITVVNDKVRNVDISIGSEKDLYIK